MNKTIFKRMLPAFIGSLASLFILAVVLYIIRRENIVDALEWAVFFLTIYLCGQFYYTRKSVLAEKLSTHTLITPLPIVYTGPKGLYSKPYLDFEKLDKVWGIEMANTFFKATIETSAGKDFISSYTDVQLLLHKENNRSVLIEYTLPKPAAFEYVQKHREHFTATVMILRKFGIKADDWKDDCYWGFFPDMQPCIFNLHPQDKSGAQHIEDENHSYLRLAAK